MKVKAAVAATKGGPLDLVGLELPEPAPGDLLVRIVACGVAAIDLEAIDGVLDLPFPFVPGSEGAGLVERVGAGVEGFEPGDAVLLGFDACGTCADSSAGRPMLCSRFADLNLKADRELSRPETASIVHGGVFGQSAFATHALCRASAAVRLGENAPLEVLACLGGDVLTGAATVLHGFGPVAGRSLLIVGADAAGLAATMMAKAEGARLIIVADSNARRRDVASDLGATVAAHTDDDLDELVRSLEADGVDLAFDTTGDEAARRACLASLGRNGAYAAVRMVGAGTKSDVPEPEGLKIVTPLACVRPGLAATLAARDLPFEVLIDHFDFEHVNDALDALRSGDVAKPVLRFSIGAFGDLDRARSEGAVADVPEPPAGPGDPVKDPAKDPTLVNS